jgi:hypothetical protein
VRAVNQRVYEKRLKERSPLDPNNTGTFLQFSMKKKKYRFGLLDRSKNGIGMLVIDEDSDILSKLKIGDKLKTTFKSAHETSVMDLMISHITPIRKGLNRGDHHVGLYMVHAAN